MSRLTWLTTTRLRNRFRRLCAIRPSNAVPFAPGSSLASAARRPWCRLGARLLRVLALGIEDGLHTLLLAALDHAPVFREVQGDPLAGHHVVVTPDPRVPDQQHALLGVVVFGPLCGAHPAVLGDDPDVPGRDGPRDALAASVQIDLHAVGILGGAVLTGHDVAREDDQTLFLHVLELVCIHGDRRVLVVAR